jgi:hypothetical protein
MDFRQPTSIVVSTTAAGAIWIRSVQSVEHELWVWLTETAC